MFARKSISRLLSKTGGARFATREPRVQYIGGEPTEVKRGYDVNLRGLKIKGNYADLPSLIFFPDLFDTAENWLPFFLSQKASILEYRNVYIVYPRNFGLSDWCSDASEEYAEQAAGDVERFMYEQKITMATLGGHGFGAKNALVTGCYKPHLVTGVLALDYAPQDYTYFRAAKTYHELAQKLAKLNRQNFTHAQFEEVLEQTAQSKKVQAVMEQTLKQKTERSFRLNFNSDFVGEHFQELVNWKWKYGIFGGRSRFIFPEYSQHVFLGNNTVSMMKVCPQNRGFFHDIFSLWCESDNPEQNHWIYEDPKLAAQASYNSVDFLRQYDGVHVLLQSRLEVANKTPIPAIRLERTDRYSGLYAPDHVHHNWKFQDDPSLK